jgi:Cu-Zn family superoxide dismutase
MTVKAVAVLFPDSSSVNGTVTFTQENENAPTQVDVKIVGLSPGEHGFHVQYASIFYLNIRIV